MDSESWREVRALFDELVELRPDQQAQRLAAIGATDPGLRASVAALLTADSQADERLGEVEATLLPPPSASPVSAPARDPFGLSGRTLAHFRIVEPLGVGGMGVVYRAEDLRLGRSVALKVPLPGYRLDTSTKQRFLHEARSAAALDHPNLCSIYEVGESEEGHPFLAMPLYPGETVKARLAREGPLPVGEAVEIARQLAEGLAAAHGAGIVHRDVKPGNVMLLPDGVVKILDFGLAKMRDLTLTGSRAQLGTVAYMAPEQFRREHIDEHTDLWALGVVLFEMLTGQRPFEGEHEVSVAYAIVHEEPLRSSALRGEIPRRLEGLLCALLRKEPASRPASAQEVAAELAAIEVARRLPLRQALGWRWAAAIGWRGRWGRRRATGRLLATGLAGVALLGALAAGIGAALVATVGGTAGDFSEGSDTLSLRSEVPSPALEPTSIAVLPFLDMSPKRDNEYFSDGMAEELLHHLSRVEGLSVAARASSFQFKGVTVDVREAGSRLGAAHLLTGSVRKDGDRMRISVQLVDARTGYQLWSQTYERQFADVFQIQDEIGRAVVDAVNIRLGAGAVARFTAAPTASLPAYESYLRGLHFLNRQQIPQATQYFAEAIRLDLQFARAHVGLAEAYALLAGYSDRPPLETLPQGMAAARTALRLDPSLAEAHAALGWLEMIDLRWEEAGRSLRRAVQLNPNSARARLNYAIYLHRRGRVLEALEQMGIARQLDPLSLLINALYGHYIMDSGDVHGTIAHLQSVLELEPSFPVTHAVLGHVYLVGGRTDEAILHYERVAELVPTSIYLGMLGNAYARAGRTGDARRIFEQLKARSVRGEYVSPGALGWILLGLDERDEGFRWLEQAVQARDVFLTVYAMLSSPYLAARYQSDPRFKDLRRRIGGEQ
jgi:eukaryotic-like serine/threonine-protein kinase